MLYDENKRTLNSKVMKTKLLMVAALTAVIGLTSCSSEDARLAGNLVGTWKGNTAEMIKGKKDKPDRDDMRDKGDRTDRGDVGEMTCTPTLTFVRTEGINGGTINLSADYTVSRGVETVATNVPVKATVNGSVSASGTWTVTDGDEIVLNLDPSKTTVAVDTASLVLPYAKLTDAPKDSLNTIKESVKANIADVIKPMFAAKIQKMRKFDDVKITGTTMTLEAAHNKLTFTKQ